MRPFSERSPRKFRIGITARLQDAWTRLPWPSPGKGEVDDPARGQKLFKSYGTYVKNQPPYEATDFDGAGRGMARTGFRPMGTFPLPVIAGGISGGARGVQITMRNPLRTRLLIRMVTSKNNTVIYLAETEMVTNSDYRIDIGENEDAWYFSEREVFAAADKTGATIFVAEECLA